MAATKYVALHADPLAVEANLAWRKVSVVFARRGAFVQTHAPMRRAQDDKSGGTLPPPSDPETGRGGAPLLIGVPTSKDDDA